MPNQNTCPKCGSSELIPEVAVVTEGHLVEGNRGVMAEVERHPRALLLKDPARTPLKATVCGGCGYTELYTTDTRELLEAYRTRQSSGERR